MFLTVLHNINECLIESFRCVIKIFVYWVWGILQVFQMLGEIGHNYNQHNFITFEVQMSENVLI